LPFGQQPLLHLPQRQIRLLADPLAELLPYSVGEFAARTAWPRRRALGAAGAADVSEQAFAPSLAHAETPGQYRHAAIPALIGRVELRTQVV
jgi:hypothetical protein